MLGLLSWHLTPNTRHLPDLVAEARIELACAAYETALEPLQVLRNKLAGEVGLEPTAFALTVRHSANCITRQSLVGTGGLEPPVTGFRRREDATSARPEIFGQGGWDRTTGPLLPRQVRYRCATP